MERYLESKIRKKAKTVFLFFLCMIVLIVSCGCFNPMSSAQKARMREQQQLPYYPLEAGYWVVYKRYQIILMIRPVQGETEKETIQNLLTNAFLEEMLSLLRSHPRPTDAFERFGEADVCVYLAFPTSEIQYGWGGLDDYYNSRDSSAIKRAVKAYWDIPAGAQDVSECVLEFRRSQPK